MAAVLLLVVGSEALSPVGSEALSPLRQTRLKAAAVSEAVPSKRDMLKFYGPALGIFMASPLMSNIDNAIIGRAAGVQSLAALSPGTVLSDQILYLFSFLGRATTGLVSRAHAKEGIEGARRELRRPLAFSFALGSCFLLPMYVFGTPFLLNALGTASSLRPEAAAYARIRGLAAPLALCQSVALSALLAVRDAATPLKVVLTAAALNLVGDVFLCCWPLRLGVAGAAAATTASTALGAAMMLRALQRRGMLDKSQWWRDYVGFDVGKRDLRQELGPLFSYAGPLSAIVLTRLLGFAAMQLTAASFGTEHLAAYQISINAFILFVFFAEPLSQTAQAILPPLVDNRDAPALRKTMANLATLAVLIGPLVALACAGFLSLSTPFITNDPQVKRIVAGATPAVFLTCLQLFVTGSLDGCLVGAKDFMWIVATGTCTCAAQLAGLHAIATVGAASLPANALAFVFFTFFARLLIYAVASGARVALGFGPLGRALRPHRAAQDDTTFANASSSSTPPSSPSS